MAQQKIAIIGGGPGGLTLARLLHQAGIAAVIYERDAHDGDRPQGGTLDLHADTGQYALRRAALEREFLAVARYDDQGVRLYDSEAALLFADDDNAGDRPEVDRTALRRILIDSLPAGTIRWGNKVERIAPATEGRHAVVAGGISESFDLVVGADGAWSRVRPLLSDAAPIYDGVVMVEFGFDDVDRRHPAIAALVGHGKMFALGDSRGLIAQRNGNAHIRGYFALRVGEAWASALFDLDEGVLRARMLGRLAGWAPELTDLIRTADTIMGVRPLCSLPVGHRWQHRPGLTLIGDAAHLMSPFGGDGVNLAMADAVDLADAIVGREGLAEFETLMCNRAAEAADGAAQGLREAISPAGPAGALAHFQMVMA